MTPFNLIDEPWLPCLTADGRMEMLGLRAALARAPELMELAGETPPVTLALHRLLLALLHRALNGPRRVADWEALWEAGRFPPERLDAYLERWRGRFDLFDAEHPFYQVAGLSVPGKESNTPSIAQLRYHSEGAATLFVHEMSDNPSAVSAAEAARLVVAIHAFHPGGTITAESNKDYSPDTPAIQAAVMLIRGQNLFQTLMLNLHRYDPVDGEPWYFNPQHDIPAWERGVTHPIERRPEGYIDLLTWQGRRVRLLPELDRDGRPTVRRALLMMGYKPPKDYARFGHETMMAFRKVLKPSPGQAPWNVLGFTEDRALWRDSLALFESFGQRFNRPKSIDWLAELVDEEVLAGRSVAQLDAIGLMHHPTQTSKLLFWKHERLTVPLIYLNDEELRSTLAEALTVAEDLGRALSGRPMGAVFVLGKELGGDKNATTLVASLGIGARYWAALDLPFAELLADLPGDGRAEDAPRPARDRWRETLRQTARAAFDEGTGGLERSARSLRAVAIARRHLEWDLRRALGLPPHR